jgi:lipoate-protein ligase A
LSRGLIAALAWLGLPADPARADPIPAGGRANPVCFEVPSAYEITVGGCKLLGSAQVRRRDGILQHGTLPLQGDLSRICLALRYEDESARELARARVRRRAATLEGLLHRPVQWNEAARALQSGFEEGLGWEFRTGETLETEREKALQLERAQFQYRAWTERI